MDKEFLAYLESTLDELRTKVSLLEKALTQLPNVTMQPDPSRPAGVMVEPAPLIEEPA